MNLILKSSGSDFILPDVGVIIATAGSDFSNIPGLIRALGQSADLRSRVNAGTVVVNNGAADLPASDGLKYLVQLWLMAGNDTSPQFTHIEGSISDAQHGTRGGGSLHSEATTSVGGFLAATDKTKLDKVQGGDITNEPHGFPNLTASAISFVAGSRLFSIAPTGASYDIYIKGVKYTKSALASVSITDTEGMWYFYFDGSGNLVGSQTIWDILAHVPIAYLYWDFTNKAEVVFGEERHGVIMDSLTHKYLHTSVGARFWQGLGLTGSIVGDGSLDAHAQVALTDGDVWDEDLLVSIRHAAVPTPPFQQYLTPIAQIPVYYISGTGQWRKWATTNFPVRLGTARLVYNLYSAPNWTTPDVDTNGKFSAVWLFATNNRAEPVVAVLGQRQDANLADAQANNTYSSLLLPNLSFAEFKVLYRLIYQTSTTYTNTVKARLRDIQDLRSVANMPAGTYSPQPQPIFGTQYQLSQSLAIQSKTGLIVWETYLTFTTASLPPGVYKINWCLEWSYSVTNRYFSTQVLLDGSAICGPNQEYMVAATPNYQGKAGFHILDLTGVTPATHTIVIQGMNANAADTGYMRNIRVEIFRVS